MTPVLIGSSAFFWRVVSPQNRGHSQVPGIYIYIGYMGVSKNKGTPKSSILIRVSLINHPFWGTTIYGNTHIYTLILMLELDQLDILWTFRASLTSVNWAKRRLCFLLLGSISEHVGRSEVSARKNVQNIS